MSDIMTPIGMERLLDWILDEKKEHGTVMGVNKAFVANKDNFIDLFGGKIETPFGPAAGPHTQLAQNIVASYYGGSRFFELKTVQKLDGEDLPVAKPCIVAEDECYNVEWSTELYIPQAFDEYVKAWFLCAVMAKEFELGAMDGYVFNMSVGYDLEGIKTKKIDTFIEGLKDASKTDIFKECREVLLNNLDKFKNITKEDVMAISPNIATSITLSTLHGCPPAEIERIATYLLTEKKVNTFIKCNPTLLGYEYARKAMDDLGFDYIAFTDFHFKDDLQYEDAIPMITKLLALAEEKELSFGVKITNTFPVDVKRKELPGDEMYMSGRSLYPLSTAVAAKLAKSFDGKLRISYSGGADIHNIKAIYDAGIWPITIATTLLKTGGYARAVQIAEVFAKENLVAQEVLDVAKVEELRQASFNDDYYKKPIKELPSRKLTKDVPLVDCFIAPCEEGCPIHQDIPKYINEVEAKDYKAALTTILNRNPLPFITGTICNHNCMTKCTRNFYDTPVHIRDVKLTAAQKGYDKVLAEMNKTEITLDAKTAIIGGGPAGIAAAHFLARAGVEVTVFEARETLGGIVKHVIPGFRIANEDIDKDIAMIAKLGVEIKTNTKVENIEELKAAGYKNIIFATGAWKAGDMTVEGANVIDALEFLADFKAKEGQLNVGKHVVVIGAGNTAMDTARAAKRTTGVETASIVYRRTKKYMPADEEELLLAIEDNVDFRELLMPVKYEAGKLICHKVELGEMDESGRRAPIETEEIVEVPCDTLIAAVGEKADAELYSNNGVTVNKKGLPIVNENNETNVANVYAIGDGLFGPAVVVKAIENAIKATGAIVKAAVVRELPYAKNNDKLRAMKGDITVADVEESTRCLSCSAVCENCVDVCPNRANVSIKVPGKLMAQIVHIDMMCNECGNCTTFCPYASSPYKDKFTVFNDMAGFENSENEGFVLTNEAELKFTVRLGKEVYEIEGFGEDKNVSYDLVQIIKAVYQDYKFLIA